MFGLNGPFHGGNLFVRQVYAHERARLYYSKGFGHPSGNGIIVASQLELDLHNSLLPFRMRVAMTRFDDTDERNHRLSGIKRIVQEDYERICNTEDPYVALNLRADASLSQVGSRYNRYERFYREENFQRLGDPELTERVIEIRRSIERAMIEIQTFFGPESVQEDSNYYVFAGAREATADNLAFGDIYFRDGLTYLRLGDFDSATEFFKKARRHSPDRGIIIAHIAYLDYKRESGNPQAVVEAVRAFEKAIALDSGNVDIYILQARFALSSSQRELAVASIAKIEAIEPTHPWLSRLKSRVIPRH